MTISNIAPEFDSPVVQGTLLAVITIVYNDAVRLEKTIASLASFYGDERFEHIVIDGGADDQTLALLQNNQVHKNFRSISEPDDGLYDAMNKGIRLAKGEFLLFLNCGDLMAALPEQVYSWLRPIAIEDKADIVCFCCRERHGNHATILKPRFGLPYKMPTSHQAMVFSREFMKTHPYDTRYRIAADFDLYLSASTRRVLLLTASEVLTEIEAAGVASENPERSYKEYLQIAAENLHGTRRWLALAIIACKCAVMIVVKRARLRNCLFRLRRWL